VWQSPRSSRSKLRVGDSFLRASGCLFFEAQQIRGRLSGQRLRDHSRRNITDAVEVLQAPLPGQRLHLRRRQRLHRSGGTPEGAHAVARLSGALEQERDAPQGFAGAE
jgi:hypothetical protein